MNTNSNIYTVIYTTVIVVVVAALLSFVSQSLKGKQEANEKADTISQMMTAAGFGTKPEFQKIGNAAVLERYAEEIESAYTVDIEGNKVSDLPLDKVYSPSELKKQNYNIKGAYFDHESETAGLGARIKDDPAFQGEFVGEMPEFGSSNVFDIVKGGSPKNDDGSELLDNKIDAITGATMTSQGLEAAIDTWLGAYSKHFQAGMAIVTILESLEDQASVETEETKKEEE